MNILNVHERRIEAPVNKVNKLLNTLATKEDKIWPYELWPKMKLDKGLAEGSSGGHGPIRYYVKRYNQGELIEFQFLKPEGLDGVHRLEILPDHDNTILKHTIEAKASGKTKLTWSSVIRPLHDALIEDAFDKVENFVTNKLRKSDWSLWVQFLRTLLK